MSHDTKQPLSSNNPLMMGGQVATNTSTGKQSFKDINGMSHMEGSGLSQKENDDSWLSQVEIITHVGPHRRLWMGPQFSFKTLQTPANAPLSSQHSQGSDKYTPLSPDSYGEDSDVQSPGFSGPMSVPVAVPAMSHYLSDSAFPPLLIEATSGSFEGPPSLLEVCGHWSDSSGASSHANGQEQLMERIADAMNESPYKERQAARTSSGSDGHTHDSGPQNSTADAVVSGEEYGGPWQVIRVIMTMMMMIKTRRSATMTTFYSVVSAPVTWIATRILILFSLIFILSWV
ncbi:hypothetical protein HPB50_016067 [Hyalomma asiaticum]|uniref:Uncharacterized protein n=1 Tax=Hyalomma asiaticum TaxID=266040 RepID=A0ACB7SID1_HYAAI|nr:hypothetical protein HPB50_016067 [Hyalomma asiaticum]